MYPSLTIVDTILPMKPKKIKTYPYRNSSKDLKFYYSKHMSKIGYFFDCVEKYT